MVLIIQQVLVQGLEFLHLVIFKLLLHAVQDYVLDSLANLLLNSDRDIFIDEVLHYFDLVFLFVYVLVHLIK